MVVRICAIAALFGLALGAAGCKPAGEALAFSPTGAMYVPDRAEAAGGPWEGYIVKILFRVPGGFTVCPRLHSEPMNYQVGSRCRQASANGMGVDTTEPAVAMTLREALGTWLELDDAEKASLTFKVQPVFNNEGRAIENYHVINFSVGQPTLTRKPAP